jgi:hypothetical protein
MRVNPLRRTDAVVLAFSRRWLELSRNLNNHSIVEE